MSVIFDSLHETGPNFSIVARLTKYPHDEAYICAFVAPMLLAAVLGRSRIGGIARGRLPLYAIVALAIVIPPVLILFSGTISLGSFRFPILDFGHPFRSADAAPLIALLLGPFAEEMLFQVGMQTKLERFGPVVAIVGATIPFWMLHLFGGFVTLANAAYFVLPALLAYAIVRQYTKSFAAATLTHMASNALATVIAHAPRAS